MSACRDRLRAAAPPSGPRLSRAALVPTREVEVLDGHGRRRRIHLPVERALTVYVDRRELVTLMTLGVAPELLVLGYLRNQRLVRALAQVESISVDWDVDAAAVRTLGGAGAALEARTARRIVTTGCGQGTVFGDLQAELDTLRLPPPAQARIGQGTLAAMVETVRRTDSIHRKAGSVHGCALFRGAELLYFVEDVGRHNALDTIAGWMWLHDVAGADKALYTTGRLTSEMVIKAAQMGVAIVVSRNGATQMGLALAERLGMALFGRAAVRNVLCYSGFERYDPEPATTPPAVRVVAG
jgi:FdhD protein